MKTEAKYRAVLKENGVSEHLIEGLVMYVVHHYQPGGFLTAVLSNDLAQAFGRGDSESLACLHGIVKFLEGDAPWNCWGSVKRVCDWVDRSLPSEEE